MGLNDPENTFQLYRIHIDLARSTFFKDEYHQNSRQCLLLLKMF